VRYLVAKGADPEAKGQRGSTPLHWAAVAESPRALSILIQAGAALDPVDDADRTPLDWAILQRKIGGLRVLLAAGADIGRVNRHKRTSLEEARRGGYYPVVQLMEQESRRRHSLAGRR